MVLGLIANGKGESGVVFVGGQNAYGTVSNGTRFPTPP